MTKNQASREQILKAVKYDPDTGIFTWLKNCPGVTFGTVAGRKTPVDGYIRVCVDRRRYLAHRLAWFYVHGVLPQLPYVIDHINGVRDDNRLSNLRVVNGTQHLANQKLSRRNSSGHRGVNWVKRIKSWRAEIQSEHLGYFKELSSAVAAYEQEFDKRFGAEYRRAVNND